VVLEEIGWTNPVKNEVILHRAKEERNILNYLLTYLLTYSMERSPS